MSWPTRGSGGCPGEGLTTAEMSEFSHALAGWPGLQGGRWQPLEKRKGRAGAELSGEVHSGDVGCQVTTVWFPEVAVPLLNLSAWGFVSWSSSCGGDSILPQRQMQVGV